MFEDPKRKIWSTRTSKSHDFGRSGRREGTKVVMVRQREGNVLESYSGGWIGKIFVITSVGS